MNNMFKYVYGDIKQLTRVHGYAKKILKRSRLSVTSISLQISGIMRW